MAVGELKISHAEAVPFSVYTPAVSQLAVVCLTHCVCAVEVVFRTFKLLTELQAIFLVNKTHYKPSMTSILNQWAVIAEKFVQCHCCVCGRSVCFFRLGKRRKV